MRFDETDDKPRRPIASVVGSAGLLDDELREQVEAIGEALVDRGFRVVCGGRDGVMEAVSRGARASRHATGSDVIAILPTYDAEGANRWVDIAIPTGLGFARNMLVVSAGNVVVAVRGGAGTLSEIALAWQIARPVLVWKPGGGWAQKLDGERLDWRQDEQIEGFDDVDALVARASDLARIRRDITGFR